MSEPNTPPLEPWLLPDGHLPTPLSVINRAKKGGQAPPEPPESTEPSQEKTGTWLDNVGDSERDMAVQNILQTARGASLILWALVEKESKDCDWGSIVSGLYAALRVAADDVDATYFASAGDLAETLEPRILAALLKKKLKRVEAKMAEDGK